MNELELELDLDLDLAIEEWERDFARTEVYYLDEHNNFVPEEQAVKRITQYLDAQGNVIQEFVAYRVEEDPEEDSVIEEIFTDADGNVVPEEIASYVIYRRYECGKLANEERVEILRDDDEDEYEDILELDEPDDLDDRYAEPVHTEIFYLDENNNFVPEEDAVKCVIRETDVNGKLLRETWGVLQAEEEPAEEDGITLESVYINADGKEVDEAIATHILFREYRDGKLFSEDRYELAKGNNDFSL